MMKIRIFVPSKILTGHWIRCKFLLFLQLLSRGRSNWDYSKEQSGCLVEEVASIVVRLSSHYFHSPKGRGKYLSSPEAVLTQTKLSSPLGLTDFSGSGNSQGHRNQMCSVGSDATVLSLGAQRPSPHNFQVSSSAVIVLELRKPTDFFISPGLFYKSQTPLLRGVNIFIMCFSASQKAGLNWSWLKCEVVDLVVESLWWSMTIVSECQPFQLSVPKLPPKWQLKPLVIPTTADHTEKWWLQVKTSCVVPTVLRRANIKGCYFVALDWEC